jgi:hypothetical protein
MCEIDYLNREISDARAALSQTVAGLKNGCAASVDVREWIKQYPWAAIGIATIVGFTAATVVTPPTGMPISEKWSHLRSKFSPDSDRSARYSRASHGRIAASILWALVDLTKLLIESLIIAALRKPTESQQDVAAVQAISVDLPECG